MQFRIGNHKLSIETSIDKHTGPLPPLHPPPPSHGKLRSFSGETLMIRETTLERENVGVISKTRKRGLNEALCD